MSTLDTDLRARHVSTEELSLATGVYYRKAINLQAPATWWDRSCDVALIIGTFVHGLGNYDAMRSDEDLPFAHNIRVYSELEEACCAANRAFQAAAAAARRVFENALESAKAKAAHEVQAAVAKAAATASEREQDALALRQGGAAADAVLSSLPETTEAPIHGSSTDDSHFVTLPRLQQSIIEAVRQEPQLATPSLVSSEAVPVTSKSRDSEEASIEVMTEGNLLADDSLPMPDSRVFEPPSY
jgi:hypothetical protein